MPNLNYVDILFILLLLMGALVLVSFVVEFIGDVRT